MTNTDLDMNELHRLYSPSVWSKRFSSGDEVIQHHVNYVTAASTKVVDTIPTKLEIEYGTKRGQKLDIIGTDLQDDAPILVYIHGGYWQELSREISRYPALSLHSAKIRVIVVGYDLCPTVTLPEIVNEILDAAKFVFEYATKLGSSGVYFAGHSAGAHLVAKLLSHEDFLQNTPGTERLQGAFLVAGVYDLKELIRTPVNDLLQLPQEWCVPMSPQYDCYKHLLARKIRIYILAGQYDSPAFIRQSKEFYEHLHDTCLMKNMYLEIKDNMDHFSIVECFTKENNFLYNLLVHDIGKYL